ncbi:MAG: hypothetical protein KDB53_17625, partial [Planctomycetes bacterium]|nr:hypothetical protein [Planctomycetota bacterium]
MSFAPPMEPDVEIVPEDDYLEELLGRLDVENTDPVDLARLALRYADLGRLDLAWEAFGLLPDPSVNRDQVGERLRLMTEISGPSKEALVFVPYEEAVSEAFGYALGGRGLLATLVVALAPGLPAAAALGLHPVLAQLVSWVLLSAAFAFVLDPILGGHLSPQSLWRLGRRSFLRHAPWLFAVFLAPSAVGLWSILGAG